MPASRKCDTIVKYMKKYMEEALKEAKKAAAMGEIPIGAVIVKDGEIIGRGHNETETGCDPTAHAEIVAIRQAAKRLGGWKLPGCSMYVTIEPCSMCAGAIVWSRIEKLYIGSMDPKAGACGSVFNIPQEKKLNHFVEIETGMMQAECSGIIRDFFKQLRKNKAEEKHQWKRVSALICLMIMAVSILAPSCFAAKETANTQKGANFNIEKTTPENNAKNVSVENLSVKIYFDTEMLPKDKASREANAKQFKLTDKKGKKIPIKVYYSHKEEGLVMVVSDTVKKDIQIEGDTEYDLTIGKNLTSTDGTKMGVSHKLHFKTLDQKGSTRIYMIMMVVMIVGMIFFSSRSAKKAMEKEKEEKGKSETVNPYKEAKRTGKSVEEIVEKDKKRKAKQAEAEEKRRAEEKKIQEEVAEKLRKESNKRVSKARPISAAGSTYKVEVKKTANPSGGNNKKGNTNPKNQTGKQKNSKNKKKK